MESGWNKTARNSALRNHFEGSYRKPANKDLTGIAMNQPCPEPLRMGEIIGQSSGAWLNLVRLFSQTIQTRRKFIRREYPSA